MASLDRFPDLYGFDDPNSHDAPYYCDNCGEDVYIDSDMTEEGRILCEDCYSDYRHKQEKAHSGLVDADEEAEKQQENRLHPTFEDIIYRHFGKVG